MKTILRYLSFTILFLFLSFSILAQHFQTVWSGSPYLPMTIFVNTAILDVTGLVANDEIAVFDIETSSGNEICVGTIVLTGSTGPFVFSASADDPETSGVQDGFITGHSIIYRFWDTSENKEITLIDSVYTDPFNEFYEPQGSTQVDLTGYSINYWSGTTDSDWNTETNWSTGIVTNAGADVVIPTGLTTYPTLTSSSTGECNNLTIESDATGNGSIIGNEYLTVNGTTNVQRYFESYLSAANGWHNISSPVNNMAISGSDFDFTSGDNDDLYQWDEPSSMWENYKGTNTFPNFENGRGYLCALETTGTLGFVGTLNESDVTENNLTDIDGGWHLRGNPFASSIEWNNGGDWVTTGIAATAKIWDEFGGTYIDIISGDIIPSTNGFFVEVANATNTLTIPVSARVHDGSNNYKKTGENELPETLVLTITNDENTYYDINRVGFKAGATEDWDYEFDSHKLFGEETAPQLWTVTNDDIFSLNYLPHPEGSCQVQLNFRAGVDATYFINADGLESFYNNTEIFLEDLLTENLINLNEQQDYEFSASTGDSEERFLLHFNGVTGIGEEISDNDINIYAHNNTVYIHFKEMPKEVSRIDIFNIVGQKVYTGSIEPQNLRKINLEENHGVYIVRIKVGNEWITQKVTIN